MIRRLAKLREGAARRGSLWSAFRRREDGSMAIEFVMLGPVYLMMVMGIFELMAISMSITGVKVGLDDVSRVIRTGQEQCLTDARVTEIVCQSAIVSNCASNLTLERQSYSGGGGVNAVDVNSWSGLNADDIIMLRASYDWPVITPMLQPFLGDADGAAKVQGAVVFKSESFKNASCP